MSKRLNNYWYVYGGISSIISSVYFWLAVLIVLANNGLWRTSELHSPTQAWSELTLSVIPSLMGFALGGMAIMLSFSSGRFLEAIRQKGNEKSYFLKTVASFAHFVFVSAAAIVAAIFDKTFDNSCLSFIGALAFVYSILLVPATAASLWSTANIFNSAIEPMNDPTGDDQ